jgi:hypothetical protein
MIRPFSLRDWALLRRLSEDGTLLHAESALTRSCQPLRGALFNMVTRGDAATYVWRAESGDSSGFVQLLLPPGQPHAQLLCLGATPAADPDVHPQSEINEDAWLFLLDGAVAAMGRRGVHSVIAEVEETGPELPMLRQAGFAVYTRQDIWCTAGPASGSRQSMLRPVTAADDWDVEWLYAHTVPPLIQVVEPVPPQEGQDWILREGDDLVAVVNLHDGRAATWMRLFVHPNAQARAEEIVAASTVLAKPQPDHPVYCCVRRYQSWLQSALVESGYALCQSQAVMVRHVAKSVEKKATELGALLQTQPAQPTTMLEGLREPQTFR